MQHPVGKPATGSFASLPGLAAISGMPYLGSRPDGSWVEFKNNYINTSLCCPARASFLTGEYNNHNGVTNNKQGFVLDDTLTVNNWLHGAGYKTGLIGKYLNLYPFGRTQLIGGVAKPYVPPNWDRWLAFQSDENAPGDNRYYNYTLIDQDHNVVSRSCPDAPPLARDDPNNCYSTDVLATAAVDFVNTSSSGPFFLYFAPSGPHNSALQSCTVANGEACPPSPVPASRHIPETPPPTLPESPNFNEGGNPDGSRNTDSYDKPQWLDSLPPLAGPPLCGVRVFGGGSRAQLYLDALRRRTDLPVTTGPIEATAIGNALAQALALGVFESPEHARATLADREEDAR